MIKILNQNKNRNNTNGVFLVGEYKFFYKLLKLSDFKREIRGYKKIKNFFPVPEILFSVSDKINGLIIFNYDSSIQNNSGLLIDYFIKNKKIDKIYTGILDLFYTVFKKTIKKDFSKSADIFFKDRIKTRINVFYKKNFLLKFRNKKIILNNRVIDINLENYLESVIKYFSENNKKTWTVISQCDPNGLNIGTKPIIFDFLGGGRNPIMAEFAVFFWSNLALDNYLAVKYNKNSYIDHSLVFKKKDLILFKDNYLEHKIPEIRKEAIKLYIEKVIEPILEDLLGFDDWYLEFKNYLAMKILGIFNVSEMEEGDQFLSLAYFSYFYSLNLKKPKDLVDILNHL